MEQKRGKKVKQSCSNMLCHVRGNYFGLGKKALNFKIFISGCHLGISYMYLGLEIRNLIYL